MVVRPRNSAFCFKHADDDVGYMVVVLLLLMELVLLSTFINS